MAHKAEVCEVHLDGYTWLSENYTHYMPSAQDCLLKIICVQSDRLSEKSFFLKEINKIKSLEPFPVALGQKPSSYVEEMWKPSKSVLFVHDPLSNTKRSVQLSATDNSTIDLSTALLSSLHQLTKHTPDLVYIPTHVEPRNITVLIM